MSAAEAGGFPAGWLTTDEANAVGQHPYVPSETAGVPRCGHPGCGAVSGDPIHMQPRGILGADPSSKVVLADPLAEGASGLAQLAAENARLADRLTHAQGALKRATEDLYRVANERDRAIAEADRLRAALEDIANARVVTGGMAALANELHRVVDAARGALDGAS